MIGLNKGTKYIEICPFRRGCEVGDGVRVGAKIWPFFYSFAVTTYAQISLFYSLVLKINGCKL